MKNVLYCVFAMVLGFCLVSCEKESREGMDSFLTISWDMGGTKADATDAEKTVNSLVFFVFDKNGMLDVAKECSGTELEELRKTNGKVTIPVKTGQKSVWALANLPSARRAVAMSCASVDDLKATSLSLADNSSSASSFVMRGFTSVNVQGEGSDCSVSLSRPVAKVKLMGVKNSLPSPYGTVVLRRAFLCNVVGNQNVAGTASPSEWLNKNGTYGSGTDKSQTITGVSPAVASVPELTFHALGDNVLLGATKTYSTPKNFYAMPNNSSLKPSGYADFHATATVLMVVVEILGVEYYYPIALTKEGKGLAANTDYTVNLTLKGLGNTIEEGPFVEIKKGSVSASLEIADWTTGTSYSEEI